MRSEIANTSASRCDTKMMATPRALERPHAVEQPLRLAVGQRRRRLVEDQEPRVLAKRAHDQHELLRREVEVAHRRRRIDIDAESLRARAAPAQLQRAVDEAEAHAARC